MKAKVDEMSVRGLRTLLMASRTIERKEFEEWQKKYENARNMIDGRAESVDQLQNEIEVGLQISGATAIEDKLQDQVRMIY